MKGISVLPEELVTEILLWLPVKSLLRFRSVCKKWQSLIDDGRQFVAEHHKRSKEYLLVKICDQVRNTATVVSLLCRRTRSVVTPQVDTSDFEPAGGGGGVSYYYLLGPCNGVFCVQFCLRGPVLWNPATRKTRTIPEPTIKYSSDHNIQYVGPFWRFGFDAKSNDYKVVCFHVAHLRNNYQSVVYAQVYRLSCDSWQEIDLINASQQPLYRVTPKTISTNNGMVVLLAEDTNARLMIMSFDFSDEHETTTTTTLFPSDYNKLSGLLYDGGYNNLYKDVRNLFVLDGRIALVNHLKQQPDHYEIWVLNEIGNEESWTKLYKFGPCSNLKLPLGNLKQHELFAESASGELIWCCPVDPTITILEWRSTPIGPRLYTINYEYEESLVRID